MFSKTFIVSVILIILIVSIYYYWPKKVRVYEGKSLDGKYKDFGIGKYTIEQIGFKEIYAIRVPQDLRVIINYSENIYEMTPSSLIYPRENIKSIEIVDVKNITKILDDKKMNNSPKDCVTSEWSDWSSCSVSCGGGTQTRTRTIIKPAENGGNCILTDTRRCNENYCQVDCKVSDWSNFSPCENINGVWNKKRTRTINTYPSFGGTVCPPVSELTQTEVCPPEDCKVSDWSDWSNCQEINGILKKTRTRYIEKPPLYGGSGCPYSELTQTEVCPIISPDSVVESTLAAWNRYSTVEKSYDNDYETSWITSINYIRETEQYDYDGYTGQWVVFKYNIPVNIKGVNIKFGIRTPSSSNQQKVKIYKNVDLSETSPIKTGRDLSNYVFPPDTLILEKEYNQITFITLNEILNLKGINNIMIMFSRDSIVSEIQFY
jgi:hypothetical protein